jgi:hypothetical protein
MIPALQSKTSRRDSLLRKSLAAAWTEDSEVKTHLMNVSSVFETTRIYSTPSAA